MTPEEVVDEYWAETEHWPLPDGIVWSEPSVPFEDPDGSTYTYGLRFGEMTALSYWHCAWSYALLNAETTAEADTAWEQIRSVPDTFLYKEAYAPSAKNAFDEVVAAAELGDFSLMQSDVERNCRLVFEGEE